MSKGLDAVTMMKNLRSGTHPRGHQGCRPCWRPSPGQRSRTTTSILIQSCRGLRPAKPGTGRHGLRYRRRQLPGLLQEMSKRVQPRCFGVRGNRNVAPCESLQQLTELGNKESRELTPWERATRR